MDLRLKISEQEKEILEITSDKVFLIISVELQRRGSHPETGVLLTIHLYSMHNDYFLVFGHFLKPYKAKKVAPETNSDSL